MQKKSKNKDTILFLIQALFDCITMFNTTSLNTHQYMSSVRINVHIMTINFVSIHIQIVQLEITLSEKTLF